MSFTVQFSDKGLPIGGNDLNMTYLYGLSDFFASMFEDTSKLNLMLEAESFVASEVYSRFLQYTSTLSLEGIQETIDGSIELVFITEADSVAGEVNTYRLPKSIASAKYIANRAFLPTELLDSEVDYLITQNDDNTCYVKFAKPLAQYSFPVRRLSNTETDQYALWFVDAHIDEHLVSKFYGNLAGVSEQNTTTRFSDFVYGLFYVYMNGPRLDSLSRGLNLALGIPVARQAETVLSIRTYLDTDQYLVICDQNQYLIPYGLEPSVREGDTLVLGTPLAEWVEIKDYEHDGEWWINLYIPEKLIKQVPAGQKDRYATRGSHFDYLMRNYLKTHTFMVKVNVANFKNIQMFSQISDIINRAKPSYTESVYIWAISYEDTLNITEALTYNYDAKWDDGIGPCISRLRRDNLDDPILRGQRSFIRYNANNKVAAIVGEDTYASVYTDFLGSDLINGFVNPIRQFRDNTEAEQGWIRAVLNRGNISLTHYRNRVGFNRAAADPITGYGYPTYFNDALWKPDLATKMIPLYTTTLSSITDKMSVAGLPAPNSGDWWFEIFSLRYYSQAINEMAINYLPPDYDPMALSNYYELLCTRDDSVSYLGREFAERSMETWTPRHSDIKPGDYLLCIKITETVVGVYWVTTSTTTSTPAAYFVDTLDPLEISYAMPLSRSGGLNGSPFYVMRGDGDTGTTTLHGAINTDAINESPINGSIEASTTTTSQGLNYEDKYNSVLINRSGVVLNHAVELR